MEGKDDTKTDDESSSDDDEEEEEEPTELPKPKQNGKNGLKDIKSPTIPAVPNNSFATDSQQIKKSAQGLYSALEALAATKNAKKLNSLSSQSKKN